MSEAGTNADDPETKTINIRVTQTFLEEIEATWKEEGYTSRSEFLRHAVRDAVEHPGLSRRAWRDIATEEYEMRKGLSEAVSREDVLAGMDAE